MCRQGGQGCNSFAPGLVLVLCSPELSRPAGSNTTVASEAAEAGLSSVTMLYVCSQMAPIIIMPGVDGAAICVKSV